mmetsp:Transcript_34577/g.136335  ORF Transcript_34577/g.136335 Transcript_34577/m.136335 type:complete len:145 (+) Transcript_34577:712-1146(+)
MASFGYGRRSALLLWRRSRLNPVTSKSTSFRIHLGLLLGVLGGQPSALQKSCRSWEELFVAGYLYTRLGGDPADRRKRSFEIASAFQPTHKALLALADSNPPEAIVVLARPGEYFYSAHLADLFSRAGKVSRQNWHTVHHFQFP